MRLVEKFTGDAARQSAAAKPPFGVGFSPEVVAKTETLEVHGSEFSDPGPDYCEFRAFDVNGSLIGSKRVDGY